MAIDAARPLQTYVRHALCWRKRWTYVLMMSLKSQTPSIDAATPRTADETMCVMGEVTLIESKLAMLIKKPNIP